MNYYTLFRIHYCNGLHTRDRLMDVIKCNFLLSQVTIANARAATAQLGPVKMDARPAAATRVVDVSILCVAV